MSGNIRKSLVLLAAGLMAGGCSTIENNHRQKSEMMQAWANGDAVTAQRLADEKSESRSGTGDELVWRLEAGTFAFTLGRYGDAIREFSICERLVSEYDSRADVSARDVGSEVGSAFSNLNTLPYRGWCRDRMGIEVYKSLAYLGEGREDAFRAQVKRLRQRQADIQVDFEKFFEQEKAEVAKASAKNSSAVKQARTIGSESTLSNSSPIYRNSLAEMRKVARKGYGNFLNPLALYLSAIGNLRDGNWDNAKIDTARLHESLPGNPFVSVLHAATLRGAGREVPADLAGIPQFNYPIDRDCIYVVFANGRGAALEHQELKTNIIKLAWPRCVFFPPAFHNATIIAGGQKVSTVPLADMDAILAEEFDKRLPGIITRTIISTLIKEGMYRGGQVAALAFNNDWRVKLITFLAVTVVGAIYREAMNTADTRSWESLPKEFQVAQMPMPADRKVQIKVNGAYGGTSFDATIPDSCRSAILYISAVSASNIRYSVLPFTSK